MRVDICVSRTNNSPGVHVSPIHSSTVVVLDGLAVVIPISIHVVVC